MQLSLVNPASTYRSYIPTHLREYLLPKETNREAQLEDAILNRYYRLIRSLIDSKILNETTYHFTCRETKTTRVHRYLEADEYEYIDPEYKSRTSVSLYMRTNDITNYAKSITAHIALQMVGRLGDIKAYAILEPAVKLAIDIMMFLRQIHCACTYALQRDEIDLFCRIREQYPNSGRNPYSQVSTLAVDATSLTGMDEIFKRCGKTYQNVQKYYGHVDRWASRFAKRRRWDLFQALIPETEWKRCRFWAILSGFTDLLDELYKRNQYVFDPAIIDSIKYILYNGAGIESALIRTLTWVESKCPGFMTDEMIEKTIEGSQGDMTTALIEWYYRNGYKFSSQHMSQFAKQIDPIIIRFGYPSIESIRWEACLTKLRSIGVMPLSRMKIPAGLDDLTQSFPEYFER